MQLNMNKASNLIERIRERPGMYIGPGKITALRHTIHGYEMGLRDFGLFGKSTQVLPEDFNDWVAYRLHYKESTSGWRNMILNSCQQDEDRALARFFDLLDEHADRKPKVIARLTGINKTYARQIGGGEKTLERYPTCVSLVAYTDDPGFFVLSDEPGFSVPFRGTGFCPLLHWIESDTGVNRSEMDVLDPEVFHRWIKEGEFYQQTVPWRNLLC